MSDDYTPTTEEVREEFIFGHQEVDMDGHVVVSFDEAKARWERWLAAVKAEAWEEGHEAAAMRVPEGVWHDTASPRTPNPYRKDEDEN